MEAVRHRIAYLSPAGSTRRVSDTIADALRSRGEAVEILELGRGGRGGVEVGGSEPTCVWVGSPVYAQHPVPQVMQFVSTLPVYRRAYGVPFVTWGAVSSGLGLWDLGLALEARGYRLLGAAKVVSVHSAFWTSADPLGGGHPNHEDLALVTALVDGVLKKIAAGGPVLEIGALDYQPLPVRVAAESAGLEKTRARMPPLAASQERCTQCGACQDVCPVGAVELAPYPVFKPECVLCYECVRACPEDAIPLDAVSRMARLRGLAEKSVEKPETRIFL